MSYTIFDRMILDRFSDAQKLVWAEIEAVIAKHGGGSDE